LLEETNELIDAIARRSGFGTSETMRRSFIRAVGVPPVDYRRRFQRALI
jgi:transcriptional regulator GlxA family with amidase domain